MDISRRYFEEFADLAESAKPSLLNHEWEAGCKELADKLRFLLDSRLFGKNKAIREEFLRTMLAKLNPEFADYYLGSIGPEKNLHKDVWDIYSVLYRMTLPYVPAGVSERAKGVCDAIVATCDTVLKEEFPQAPPVSIAPSPVCPAGRANLKLVKG